jgi:hypothetical protein
MSFNDAFKIISQLVKDFKENEKHIGNTAYSEAEIAIVEHKDNI